MEFRKLGKGGEKIPVLGMGTWRIGGDWIHYASRDRRDVEALKFGLKLGMNFIDTAESYGRGHSEELVGKAIGAKKAFIATKVSPEHFHYDDVIKSCNASLRRLGIKQIDLYQLHWPNPKIPIRETMRAMEKLVDEGKIRYIGVSNFSVEQTVEAQSALSKNEIVSNQVEYSLLVREVENDILPFCKKEKMTLIAYRPLAKGLLFKEMPEELSRAFDELSRKYEKTVAQIALNWLIDKERVIAIPKSSNTDHLKENLGAVGWKLDRDDIKLLEDASGKAQRESLKRLEWI